MRTLVSIYITLFLFTSSSYSIQKEDDNFDFQLEYSVDHPFGEFHSEHGCSINPLHTTSAPMDEIIRTQQQLCETDDPSIIDSIVLEKLRKWDLLSPGVALLGAMKGSVVCLNKLCEYDLFPTDYPLSGITNYVATGKIAPSKKGDTEMKALGYGLQEPTIIDMPEPLAEKWHDIIIREQNTNNPHFCTIFKYKEKEIYHMYKCPLPVRLNILNAKRDCTDKNSAEVEYCHYMYRYNLKNREETAIIFIRFHKHGKQSFFSKILHPIRIKSETKEEGLLLKRTISFYLMDNFSLIFSMGETAHKKSK